MEEKMKISILSDIHVDEQFIESDPIEDALVKVLNEEKPYYLIIAGDIANDYRKSLEILYLLEKRLKQKYCLFLEITTYGTKKTTKKTQMKYILN